MCEFGFLQISRKVKVLELRVVLSAQTNMHIAVILSQKLTLYDLRKPRYRYTEICENARDFGRDLRGPLTGYS